MNTSVKKRILSACLSLPLLMLALSQPLSAAVISEFDFSSNLSPTGGTLLSDTSAFSGSNTSAPGGVMNMLSSNSGVGASALFTLTNTSQLNLTSLTFDASKSGKNGRLEISASVDGFSTQTSVFDQVINPGFTSGTAILSGLGVVSTDISFLFEYFSVHNSQASTAAIDNVVLNGELTAVPVPAAAWLMLSGLAGMGLLSRRRPENEVFIT